jgi:NAD(P)-dependent dehydrogenase (short-subunit alcohol dehydrogenase family)
VDSVGLQGKSALVTGGTRGLGKAIGLEFARAGAMVFLTHRWGSVDENELTAEFQAEGLLSPRIVESDASDAQDTRALLEVIKEQAGCLDIVVSNVAFAKIVSDLGDYKKSALELSLGYSSWPIVDLIQRTHEITGQFPRYVVAISSNGSEVCHYAYDFVGISKAVLETLCRYLALRLKRHGVRVNAIRPGFLDTGSSRATFGDAVVDAMKERVEGMLLDPQGIARVCVALCSGLMDAVTGQVITVDEGWSLVSPVAYITGNGLPGEFPKTPKDVP